MSRNSSANTRVSIPGILRKTIQDIKEVSGNHSDEDVYAMLKECSMDPNETAQRLLFLDTFHEVKRKQKRKDNVNGRMLECSTWKRTSHRRGARSGLGSFSSQYKSPERVTAVRKENGLEVKRERGLQSPSLPVLKEVEAKLFPPISKTSFALVNGPTCLPSDGLYDGHAVQNSETVTPALPIHVKDAGLIKPVTTPPLAKLNEERVPFAGKIYTSEFCSSRSEKSEHISLVMPKMKNGESLGTEKLSFFPVPDTAQSSLLHAAGPDKGKPLRRCQRS